MADFRPLRPFRGDDGRMRSVGIVLIGLLLVAGSACGGDEEPAADPAPTPLPSATPEPEPSAEATPTVVEPESDCPNEAGVTTGDDSFGRSLKGDVSGDGEPDVITIVRDDSGPQGCQTFLIVESAEGEHSTPIDQEGMSTDVGFPALVSLADIDGDSGLDVVMNMVAGASTQFSGVFTAAKGVPERLRFEQPTEFGDLFPTGGSVGHLEASDCVGPGAIVITQAVPQGDEYKITRTAYVVVGGLLTPQEEGVKTARLPIERLDRFPEFRASPFGSCPTD